MPKIQVDRNVIIPAGQPRSSIGVGPPKPGFFPITVLEDGVRVTVYLAPEESVKWGVALIQGGTMAAAMQAGEATLSPSPSPPPNDIIQK